MSTTFLKSYVRFGLIGEKCEAIWGWKINFTCCFCLLHTVSGRDRNTKVIPIVRLAGLRTSLEYNITSSSIEKTGRKPCSIREHIIGIVKVSQRDFENVTCVWSCNVYAL